MNGSLKILGIVFVLSLFLFGCIAQPTNIQPVGNNSSNITPSNLLKTAKLGDLVAVDYTLRLENGSVVDTSILSIANDSGLYNPNRGYSPLVFKLAYNSGLINGFIDGVLGMQINQTKEVVVQPQDGYGLIDQTKIYDIPLYYNRSRFEKIPRASLEQANITIENGSIFFADIGMVSVHEFDNETVTIRYLFSTGKKFTYSGIPQEVVNITNDTLFIKFDFEQGKTYILENENGAKKMIKVVQINETAATLDENHQLAGKVLYFTLTLRDITG